MSDEITKDNYLDKLFIDEVKPLLNRSSGDADMTEVLEQLDDLHDYAQGLVESGIGSDTSDT